MLSLSLVGWDVFFLNVFANSHSFDGLYLYCLV